jgi:hypothetical protein
VRSAIGVLAILVSGGCERATPRPPSPPSPPLGSTHVAPETEPADPPEPPISAERFESTVRALAEGDPRLDHAQIIAALRELATALEVRAPARSADIDAMRRAADELERSPIRSLQHANYTRFGLEAALRVFSAITPYRGRGFDEYNEVMVRLRRQLDRIDPETPLMQQHEAVARVFATAVQALNLAYGAETTARR